MGNIMKLLFSPFNKYNHLFRLNAAMKYLENLGEGRIDVDLHKTSGIATITINNPKKKNAMSGKMMVEFYHAVTLLESWPYGKAIILKGAEDCFCSGGDLDIFKQIAADGKTTEMSFFMTHTMNRLTNLPLITFSYITGRGAFGGGAEIAISTDFTLIHPESKIAFIHATMGVTPAWGGGFRLCERLGTKKALEMLLQSKVTSATSALELGLVDGISTNDNEVKMFMDDKLRHDTEVVTSIKNTILAKNANECSNIFAKLLGGESNNKALAAKLKHS